MNERFKKNNDIMTGKGEADEVKWITVNGAHIPVKAGESPQKAIKSLSKDLIKKSKNGIVELPKQEYAEFCSAIRTRYADSIPSVGGVYLANDYYRFAYNNKNSKIVCKAKIPIVGNEEKIKVWESHNV